MTTTAKYRFALLTLGLLLLVAIQPVDARPQTAENDRRSTAGDRRSTAGDLLALEPALRLARTHLAAQAGSGHAPLWRAAVLGEGQALSGLGGAQIAYLFPVYTAQGGEAGYIVVALNTQGVPLVVEFAIDGPTPLQIGLPAARRALQSQGLEAPGDLPVYVGPGQYLLRTASALNSGVSENAASESGVSENAASENAAPSGQRFYSLGSGSLVELPAALPAGLLQGIPIAVPEPYQGNAEIPGVPEWQQFKDQDWACYSGCVPTSLATIFGYWEAFYPGLMGGSWQDLTRALRGLPALGAHCVGESAFATMDAVAAANYVRDRGYAFTAEHGPDPNLSITRGEIDASRPLALGFQANSYWTEGHSVVGIGYNNEYLIVRDNWPGKALRYETAARPFWTMRFCPPGQCSAPAPAPLVCPETGGVLLYKNANYNCGGEAEGSGFARSEQSGLLDVPALLNDQASSLRLPDGWSALLFEHSAGGGGRYCAEAPGVFNFSGLSFDNGGGLDNNVSSFQVFTQPGCAASTPNDRQDNSPPYGSYLTPGVGETLGRSAHLYVQAGDDGAQASGVARLEFGGLWDGAWRLIGRDDEAPYEFDWDLCDSGVPDGMVQLGLKVTDFAGNQYTIPSDQLPYFYKSYNCSPAGQYWMWGVGYWNDKDFGGSQVSSAVVGGGFPYLFFHWKDASPSEGVNADNWAARFSQSFYFPGDDYRFHCQHDDGCRIFVDGENWIDAWWPGYGGNDMTRYLSGQHTITVEYMDLSGDATLEVWWQGAGYLPHDILPENMSEYSHFWRAEYWTFTEVLDTTPQFTRLEGDTLDHEWGDGGPDPMLPFDNFRAKFTRLADFDCGSYRFHVEVDDGVRLRVDDQIVLDSWQDQMTSFDVDVFMTHGEHSLRLDYYEHTGGSQVSLSWTKLDNCAVAITPQYISPVYVQPGEWFAPTVRLQIDSGYLDPLRADTLAWAGGEAFSGASEYVRDSVEAGQRYSFDANSPDPFWLSSSGYGDGIYTSQWQARLGDGAWVGPLNEIQVVVDGGAPLLQFTSPQLGDLLSGTWATLQAAASDNLSGIEQVEFFAYYLLDGVPTWQRLGADVDGSDGWSWDWYIGSLPSQTYASVYAYAWDRAHNGYAAPAVTDLRLETSGASWRSLYLPLMQRGVTGGGSSEMTFTVAGDAELGNIGCTDWAVCWGAAEGNYLIDGYADAAARVSPDLGYGIQIKRPYLFFDTSALPSGATILSAELHVYIGLYQEGDPSLYLVDANTAPPLVYADFNNPDRAVYVKRTAAENVWLTYAFSAELLSAIQAGGWTGLTLMADPDLFNYMPSAGVGVSVGMMEDAAHAAYLVVRYR